MDDPQPLSESGDDPLARLVRGAQALHVDYDLDAALARHERLVAAGVPALEPATGRGSRWMWMSGVIAVAGVTAILATRPGGDDGRAAVLEVAAAPMEEIEPVERAKEIPEPAPRTPEVAPAAVPATEAPRERIAARRAPSAPSRPVVEPTAEKSDDRIAREAANVRRIRELLDGGDAAEALRACETGDREFGDGVFTLERDGLRVLASLALDRPSASEAADAYLGAHPRAPLARRIRDALAQSPE